MSQDTQLTPCAVIAQDKDKDRFLTALMAAPEKREAIFTLIAFNHEIAKTRESVSEVMLGQIRLQWWREAVEECYGGTVRHHEVVEPMADAVRIYGLSRELLDQMIDARERDMGEEEFRTVDNLINYARNTGGLLNELNAEILGGRDEDSRRAARQIGTAWALVGIVRALPFSLRQRRIMVPQDLIKTHDIDRQDLLELRNPENLKPALREICVIARDLIDKTREQRRAINGNILPCLHLAGFADGYLRQLEKAGFDSFSPMLARPPALRNLGLLWRQIRGRF